MSDFQAILLKYRDSFCVTPEAEIAWNAWISKLTRYQEGLNRLLNDPSMPLGLRFRAATLLLVSDTQSIIDFFPLDWDSSYYTRLNNGVFHPPADNLVLAKYIIEILAHHLRNLPQIVSDKFYNPHQFLSAYYHAARKVIASGIGQNNEIFSILCELLLPDGIEYNYISMEHYYDFLNDPSIPVKYKIAIDQLFRDRILKDNEVCFDNLSAYVNSVTRSLTSYGVSIPQGVELYIDQIQFLLNFAAVYQQAAQVVSFKMKILSNLIYVLKSHFGVKPNHIQLKMAFELTIGLVCLGNPEYETDYSQLSIFNYVQEVVSPTTYAQLQAHIDQIKAQRAKEMQDFRQRSTENDELFNAMKGKN